MQENVTEEILDQEERELTDEERAEQERIEKRIEAYKKLRGGKIPSLTEQAFRENLGERYFYGQEPEVGLMDIISLIIDTSTRRENYGEYTYNDIDKDIIEYDQYTFRTNFYKIVALQVDSGFFTIDDIKNNIKDTAKMFIEQVLGEHQLERFEGAEDVYINFDMSHYMDAKSRDQILNDPKILATLTGNYPDDPFRGFDPNFTNIQLTQIENAIGDVKNKMKPNLLMSLRFYSDLHKSRTTKTFMDPEKTSFKGRKTNIKFSKLGYKLETESLEKLGLLLNSIGMKKEDLDNILNCENPKEVINNYCETHTFKKNSLMNYEELKAMDPKVYNIYVNKFKPSSSLEFRLSSNNVRQSILLYKIAKDEYSKSNIFQKIFSSKFRNLNNVRKDLEKIITNKVGLSKEQLKDMVDSKPEEAEKKAIDFAKEKAAEAQVELKKNKALEEAKKNASKDIEKSNDKDLDKSIEEVKEQTMEETLSDKIANKIKEDEQIDLEETEISNDSNQKEMVNENNEVSM